jgi:glycosyltransferase involved in cell wall biosynthesis
LNPQISIIVPCYNEQSTIHLLLEAIWRQTYPRAAMEVVIADGGSQDATLAEVERFCQQHPDLAVRCLPNPRRNIPAGLNTALGAAAGKVIIRLDAHSVPAPDYVAQCVASLEAGLGDNVGGVWEIQPGGPGATARAIAAAASHRLGVGDARYRYTTQAGEVDTVPFGAYRRELFQRIGRFDETLLTNEDYEFNARVRQAGGRVYLNPAIRSAYFARATFGGLARQYWRYGYWKRRMLQRYPNTLRWRQALPPLFVLSLVLLGIGSLFLPAARVLLALEVGLYLLILIAAGAARAAQTRDWALLPGLPAAIATMHLAWGAGFLVSLFDRKRT